MSPSRRGCLRHNARRDAVEPLIVETLQKRGFTVDRVSAPGFPDLVVSLCTRLNGKTSINCGPWEPLFRRDVWFVEVKQPKGKLKPAQVKWQEKWQGPPVIILRSIEAALRFPDPYEEPVTERRTTIRASRPRALSGRRDDPRSQPKGSEIQRPAGGASVGSELPAQSTGTFVVRDVRGDRRLAVFGEFRGRLICRNIETNRLSYVRPNDPRIVRETP